MYLANLIEGSSSPVVSDLATLVGGNLVTLAEAHIKTHLRSNPRRMKNFQKTFSRRNIKEINNFQEKSWKKSRESCEVTHGEAAGLAGQNDLYVT